MKKQLLFIFVIVLSCISAMAQGYNRGAVEYGRLFDGAVSTEYHKVIYSLNSISAEYTHGFRLGKGNPGVIELGGQINYMFANRDNTEKPYIFGGILDLDPTRNPSRATNLLGLTVPVRLLLELNAGRGFKIVPFVGLYARCYLVGKEQLKYYTRHHPEDNYTKVTKSEDILGESLKRFMAGWNIGLGLEWHRMSVRASFGTTFYHDKASMNPTKTLTVGAGYKF